MSLSVETNRLGVSNTKVDNHSFKSKRQIQDKEKLDRIKSSMKGAFYCLQFAKGEVAGKEDHFLQLKTNPENDWANIGEHMTRSSPLALVAYTPQTRNGNIISPYELIPTSSSTQESYSHMIWQLQQMIQTTDTKLEDVEIALILIESLMSNCDSKHTVVDRVWRDIFHYYEPKHDWDQDIGHTAIEVLVKLLPKCFDKKERLEFRYISNFLSGVEKTLSVRYREQWRTEFIAEIDKLPEQAEEFRKALFSETKGKDTCEMIKRLEKTLTLRKWEAKLNSDELEEVLREACSEEVIHLDVWNKIFESVASSNLADPKRLLWVLWTEKSVLVERKTCSKLWTQASKLLDQVEPSEVARFFSGPVFAAAMKTYEDGATSQTQFYQSVLERARELEGDCSSVVEADRKFVLGNASLKGQYEQAKQALGESNSEPNSQRLTRIVDSLEKGFLSTIDIWCPLMEKVAASDLTGLKKRVWELWQDKSSSFTDPHSLAQGWVQASKLLVHGKAVEFFCSGKFADILKTLSSNQGAQLHFYNGVIEIGGNSEEDRKRINDTHKQFMEQYRTLQEGRTKQLNEKLNGKRIESNKEIEEVVEDLERDDISNLDIWNKALEKVIQSKSPVAKNRVWQLWLKRQASFGDQKSYLKMWLRVVNLLQYADPIEAYKFFIDPLFGTLLTSLSKDHLEALPTFYECVLRNAIKQSNDISTTLEQHRRHLSSYAKLNTVSIFDTIWNVITAHQKEGYSLFKIYLCSKDANEAVIKRIRNWLSLQLKGCSANNNNTKDAIELAEVGLQVCGQYPGDLESFEIAKGLRNVKGENNGNTAELAMKYAIKNLILLSQDKTLPIKTRNSNYDECFELMSSLLNQLDDKQFLSLLQNPELTTVKNICSAIGDDIRKISKGVNFWKGVITRCSKMQNDMEKCLSFTIEVWPLLKEQSVANEVATNMIEVVLSSATSKKDQSDEECGNELLKNCQALVTIFAPHPLYTMAKGSIVARKGLIDDLIFRLCDAAKDKKSSMFMLLSVACQLVMDEKYFEYYRLNGTAKKLILACLDIPELYKTPKVPSSSMLYHQSISNLLFDYQMNGILKDIIREDHSRPSKTLSELRAIFLIPLNQMGFLIDNIKDEKTDIPHIAEKLKSATNQWKIVLSSDLFPTEFKKSVLDTGLHFACGKCEKMPNAAFNNYILDLEGFLYLLIADGIEQKNGVQRVKVKHLTNVVQVLEKVSKSFLDLLSKLKDLDKRCSIFFSLLRMSKLFINYQEGLPAKKNEVFFSLLRFAYEFNLVDSECAKIINIAKESQFESSYTRITFGDPGISVEVISDSNEVSNADKDVEKRREGIRRLFRTIMLPVGDSHSVRQLKFIAELLTMAPFLDFRDEESCYEMMKIYRDIITVASKLNAAELLKSNFFYNFFFSLTHIQLQKDDLKEAIWNNFHSFEELVGPDTKNGRVHQDAQKWLKYIIGAFTTIFLEACKDSSQFSKENKAACSKDFIQFLDDCKNCGYFDQEKVVEFTNAITVPDVI